MKNKTYEVWLSILAIFFVSVFALGIVYLLSSEEKSLINVKSISFVDILDQDSTISDSFVEATDSESITEEATDNEADNTIEEVIAQESETANVIEETKEENVSAFEETFVAIHNAGNLRVRSGPSVHDDIIAFLQPGDSGKVIERGNEWSLISFVQKGMEISGYVNSQFIQFSSEESGYGN